MNLAARFWTASNALIKYAWCGLHMADAYSNFGLISDLYANNFTCGGGKTEMALEKTECFIRC